MLRTRQLAERCLRYNRSSWTSARARLKSWRPVRIHRNLTIPSAPSEPYGLCRGRTRGLRFAGAVAGCDSEHVALTAGAVYQWAMRIAPGTLVCLPRFAPYPLYGRVVEMVDEQHVRVTQVECGDPRCASEHAHADAVWPAEQVESAHAYQGRAAWEEGRMNSPNAVLLDDAA